MFLAKNQVFEMNGIVIESLKGAQFLVEFLEMPGKYITCTLAGKLRKNSIRVLPGDYVKVEVSVYNPEQGRISYRYKDGDAKALQKKTKE